MQYFRGTLTRIGKQLEAQLPDGPDVYGYDGVSKESLLAAVSSAHELAGQIRDENGVRFEVIALKRAGTAMYEELKAFLEDSNEDARRSGFNRFLTTLSSLLEKVRITYFIVVKDGLRRDEELAQIRNATVEESRSLEELRKEREDLGDELLKVRTALEGIQEVHNSATGCGPEIQHWHSTAQEEAERITAIHGEVEGWKEDVEATKTNIADLLDPVKHLASRTEEVEKSLEENSVALSSRMKALVASGQDHAKLLDDIRDTLAGATRAGMAASFENRQKSLSRQQIVWGVVFGVAILGLVLGVWRLVIPVVQNEASGWREILGKMAIVSPLVWLGWFSARQYGFTSRIREDYAFKAAAAMAYEGFKKVVRESHPELERALLEFSLFNFAQDPIRLFGKYGVAGTPAHEVLQALLERLPEFRRIKGKVPGFGSFNIDGREATRGERLEKPDDDE